jgi:uncharacterized membrane protein YqjE
MTWRSLRLQQQLYLLVTLVINLAGLLLLILPDAIEVDPAYRHYWLAACFVITLRLGLSVISKAVKSGKDGLFTILAVQKITRKRLRRRMWRQSRLIICRKVAFYSMPGNITYIYLNS